MGEEVLKKFGRYFLLDRVAQGGMAEIYRARLASTDGAGRLLVIKRIQAGYGANAEFLQMFKSEIKVTMGFNHPNIVQLYDFGEEQQQPYIAMEFVDGKNLRQFIGRFAEKKEAMPVELAAYIIAQAAAGLHYAHSFKDKITGDPLNIVHRDISPQNILISYDGNIKVIDFGIAKAATNSEETRAGIIKGKPSYLSPEQITGESLDGRCDIFALGIVLWESLTGRKLFAAPGESEFAVLKLIENCTTYVKPPSKVNPAVPKELDYIVLKALAKQREKRYQTADELQRALHRFITSHAPEFNPADLSQTIKSLFTNDIVEDRKSLQKLNGKVEQLLSMEIPDAPVADDRSLPGLEAQEPTAAMRRPAAPGAAPIRPPVPEENSKVDLKALDSQKIEIEATHTTQSYRPNRAAAPPGMPGPGATQTGLTQGGPPRGPAGAMPRQGATQTGMRQAGSESSKGSGLKTVAALAAGLLVVGFIGPRFGFEVPVLSAMLGSKKAPSTAQFAGRQQGGEPSVGGSTAPANTILLRLNVPPGAAAASITVNGQVVDDSNPVIRVPLDAPLELVAEREGYKGFRREFVLQSRDYGNLSEYLMEIPLEPVQFGYLTLHTTPSATAHVRVVDPQNRAVANQGRPWLLKTPIENEKFPVGTYTVRLENDVLGMEKTVTIQIQEGRDVRLDERLEIKH